MGIIKRQSFKGSIVTYVGVLIGLIFFVLILPNIISEEYLGLISVFQNGALIFSQFTSLGFAPSLFRYHDKLKQKGILNSFNGFAMFVLLVGIALFVAFYFIFRKQIIDFYIQNSSLFVRYYLYIIPLVVLQTYIQYFEMYTTALSRVAAPALIREIVLRLLIILCVLLLAYHAINEVQFVYFFCISYFIAFIILAIYCIRVLHFGVQSSTYFMAQFTEQKALFSFAALTTLTSILFNLQNFIDVIMIPSYLGLGVLGIYFRPFTLAQLISIPYRSVSLATSPILLQAWHENDMDKMITLNKKISINILLIGLFLSIVLLVNAHNYFYLVPTKYSTALNVLYIVVLGRALDMSFGLNTEILYTSKYYYWVLIFSAIMVVVCITLNIILLPRYGMEGAAWAGTVSLTIFNILKSGYIYYKFKFHVFSKHFFSLLLIAVLAFIIVHYLPSLPIISNGKINKWMVFADVTIKFLSVSSLFLLPVYYFKISPDFNDFISLLLSGKIFKGGHKMDEL